MAQLLRAQPLLQKKGCTNPQVRLRIDDAVFALRAVPVVDAKERSRVIGAYAGKCGVDPNDNIALQAPVYRLDAR